MAFSRIRIGQKALSAAAVMLLGWIAAPAHAETAGQNPGCGLTGLTAQQKIERNRRLAEYYYQGYLAAPTTRRLANFADFQCWAENPTIQVGVLDPLGKPRTYPGDPNSGQGAIRELRSYWTALPDFGALPDTFVAYPSETGVMWRQVHGGHSADGKLITVWEVCYIAVNDAGKITHYETWVDSIGMAKVIELSLGKKMEGMSTDEYAKAVHEKGAK